MIILNIGDKVIIKREICANNLINPHFDKIATILKVDKIFDRIQISIDDFPNCNHRDYHNKFWYLIDEVEVMCEWLESDNCDLARFKKVCKKKECKYYNSEYNGIYIK